MASVSRKFEFQIQKNDFRLFIGIRFAKVIPCYRKRKDCSSSFSDCRPLLLQARLTKLLLCLPRPSMLLRTSFRGFQTVQSIIELMAACIRRRRIDERSAQNDRRYGSIGAQHILVSLGLTVQFVSKLPRAKWSSTNRDKTGERRTIWTSESGFLATCDNT